MSNQLDHLERRREELAEALPDAQRGAARAFADGADIAKAAMAVSSIRAELQALDDVIAGLRLLQTEREIERLVAEIARRESAWKRDAERVERLRVAGTRRPGTFEGLGHALALAERRDRESRADDFAAYAQASNALWVEREAIETLERRRCELTGEHYQRLGQKRPSALI